MPSDRFEDALQQITHRFAMEVVELIRTTTVQELTTLTSSSRPVEGPAAPATGRKSPPKARTQAQVAEVPAKPSKHPGSPSKKATAAAPVGKSKKRKNKWPSCSVTGCTKKMYPGSGKNRLCYGHHLDAGGKQSPLLATRKKKAAPAAAEAPKAEQKPKTLRRKKVGNAKR